MSLKISLDLRMEEERYFSLRQRGIFFLDDEINEGTFSKFCRDAIYIASGGSFFQELNSNPLKQLWIILNSPGGDVLHGLAIYDNIRMLVGARKDLEVNVLAMGMAASMAAAILQAGTKRLALPSTQFLIHHVRKSSFFESDEVNIAEEKTQELQRLNRIFMSVIADRTGVDLDELLAKTKKFDLWIDCERARAFGPKGLIDEVITTPSFLKLGPRGTK